MMGPLSIRYKFLIATTLLLVVCVGAYSLIAIDSFRQDKRDLVFDYNSNLVSNLSSDLDSFFTAVGDKMKLAAVFSRDKKAKNSNLIEDLLRKNSDIVHLSVSYKFKKLDRHIFHENTFAETYGLTASYFEEEVEKLAPIPFEQIQLHGEAIWNATLKDGPPLIGFGKSVIEENERGIPMNQFAVVAYVNASKIAKALSRSKLNEVFVTNAKGEALVTPITESSGVSRARLVELALNSKLRTQVSTFNEKGASMMGAFSKAFNDQILVLSQVSENTAFAAVDRLVYRSVFFALIPLTLAFMVAILFSRSLTRPIEVLVGGMKKVSGGDLTTRIQVNSKDEISSLASSFNEMISELRQSRAQLEEINRELENKVRARTMQLQEQNQAVKQAQEALLRTTRLAAVGEVAGQTAHEVLNPITSIMSRLKKVQKKIDDFGKSEIQVLQDLKTAWVNDHKEGGFKKLQEAWQETSKINSNQSLWEEDMGNLELVQKNLADQFHQLNEDARFLMSESERISRIVNSMRTMSKVSGDIKTHSGHSLVDRSIKIMADLASQDSVELKVDLRAHLDSVEVDEDEFIQVMTNIIRNALQSITMHENQQQSGEIRVQTKVENSNFEVHITDNGQGIEEKNKKRLFEKHFTTKQADGTGIGLSISRRLIRAFKGDIYLKETRLGEGATFVISLPLKNESGRASA